MSQNGYGKDDERLLAVRICVVSWYSKEAEKTPEMLPSFDFEESSSKTKRGVPGAF